MQIKIVCGQMEVIPGRPDINFEKIQSLITEAKSQQADILLLPEMCIPGYLIGDMWEQQSFLDDCEFYNNEIAQNAQDICIIFGSIAVDKTKLNEDGRVRKYNAAFVCQNGKMLPGYAGKNYIIKNSLPNYREFDDARYFYSLQKLCSEENTALENVLHPVTVNIKNTDIKLGVMLCEDGWTDNYTVNIPQLLAAHQADILLNISCSPYTIDKNKKRNKLFSAQAKAAGIPLLYCNNTGIQNNGKNIFTYDGSSCAYNNDGSIAAKAEMYAETLLPVIVDTTAKSILSHNAPYAPDDIEEIYHALRYGAEKFMQQCHISKMTIGLSGGIDSAVTAAMFVDILGAENVLLINMPSQYNSTATRNIAQQIAANLGTNYAIIPISESCRHTEKQLTETEIYNYGSNTSFKLTLSPLNSENIQARDRGARIIAAAASAFGGAFSCNSNKAEITVGYATFYGDICGALALIGDLWKYQVYALGAYLNQQVFGKEVIPAEIFDIRPSAELSASQTVGVGGDPLIYEYHDFLFKAFVESWHKVTPEEILHWYVNGTLAAQLGCEQQIIDDSFPEAQHFIADLEKWWRLFSGFAVAKRIQAPPIVSISKRAFGYDHREAQLTPYFSRKYLQLKEQLLQK